ncbi:MAG TPA: efflux RND transporter periplasmic adaptor subunit, partial [Gemmatimonadales bacterium]|nr:efflux RND transporter periplasmic adaptor subunit [Gemmatimonadales bacterium]
MSRGMKVGLIIGVLALAGGGGIAYSLNQKKKAGTEVRMEEVARRDLVAAVTASGKIEPKTSVDISADITGRIIRIAVEEGDLVTKGQFLLQIDPAQYQSAVSRAEGVVNSTQATLLQVRASRDQAERAWKRADQLTRLGPNLIAPAAAEEARTALDVAEATYQATRAQLDQSRASLAEARDNLAKTRLVSPISGRVVRLAVEEGEVAVPGTFSRETGLLLTIADLSVILAKVQVDETDVVRLAQGDSVEVSIDAYPDSTFVGHVTRISQSAKLTSTQTASGSNDRAVDFDVEIRLDEP